jgi:hypothetical protein
MSGKGVVYLLLGWGLLSHHRASAQSFSRVLDPALNATAKATACAWGDFNNDGHLDLFLADSTDRPSIIFVAQGNGTFAISALPDAWAAQGGSWGDFNNDGHLDLARTLLGITGGLYIHSNNGNGTFTADWITGLSVAPVWLDYGWDWVHITVGIGSVGIGSTSRLGLGPSGWDCPVGIGSTSKHSTNATLDRRLPFLIIASTWLGRPAS